MKALGVGLSIVLALVTAYLVWGLLSPGTAAANTSAGTGGKAAWNDPNFKAPSTVPTPYNPTIANDPGKKLGAGYTGGLYGATTDQKALAMGRVFRSKNA